MRFQFLKKDRVRGEAITHPHHTPSKKRNALVAVSFLIPERDACHRILLCFGDISCLTILLLWLPFLLSLFLFVNLNLRLLEALY
jgi:hypothetical protein